MIKGGDMKTKKTTETTETSKKIPKERYRSIVARSLLARIELKEDEFIKWWEETDDKCEYCNITTENIRKLMATGGIHTKRIGTRGLTMEVDRKDPTDGYNIKNIVKCCYWCNNAKTDEFSYEEFQGIAQGIERNWEARIKDCEDDENDVEPFGDAPMCDWDTPRGVVFTLPWGMHSVTDAVKHWEILRDLVKQILSSEMAVENENFEVVLLYKDCQEAKEAIRREKILPGGDKNENCFKECGERVKIQSVPHLDDVWVRDYMPIVIRDKEKERAAVKAVYSPTYFTNKEMKGCQDCRRYSWYSHMAGIEAAEALGFELQYLSGSGSGFWFESLKDPVFEAIWDKSKLEEGEGEKKEEWEKCPPVILDGGNLIHNGKIGIVSARVITENIDESFSKDETEYVKIKEKSEGKEGRAFIETLQKRLGLEKLFIFPTEKVDGKPEATGHLDGTMRFLNEKTLLVDAKYLERNKDRFNELPKSIEVFSVNQKCENKKNKISAKGIVLNYLRLKDTIFLPKFTGLADATITIKGSEKPFKDFLEGEGRNLKVINITENGTISEKGGVFNCISWVY
jgi:hypothetical protein